MSIADIINSYNEKYTPYMGSFVNHLPMGQLAVYKMTDDLERVETYSEHYTNKSNIDKIKTKYPDIESLEKTLGKRDLYESALDIIKKDMDKEKKGDLIKKMLNKYNLGMSSGLFHVLIRLAYSVEGYEIDCKLIEEVERALAYYITAYREADVFTRKIKGQDIIDEMKKLQNKENVRNAISSNNSLGQTMKVLYEDENYLNEGFIVQGNSEEKLKAVLELSLNSYLNSGSIVALHCITGLHALIVLKDYQDDFSHNLDILTTCIITHLVSSDIREFEFVKGNKPSMSWAKIHEGIENVMDVHAVKLAYTGYELDKLYFDDKLKAAAIKRLGK